MNKNIDILNQELNYIISSSNLPIGVVYLIVKNIYYELEKAYNDFLQYEKIQKEKNNEEDKENSFLEKENKNEEIEPIYFLKEDEKKEEE